MPDSKGKNKHTTLNACCSLHSYNDYANPPLCYDLGTLPVILCLLFTHIEPGLWQLIHTTSEYTQKKLSKTNYTHYRTQEPQDTAATNIYRNTLIKTITHVMANHSPLNKDANAKTLSLQSNTTYEINLQ